jgi:hypothetical protein
MTVSTRWSTTLLCCGMITLAACDDSHTPLAPQPDAGSALLAPAPSGLVAFYPFDQSGPFAGATHRPTGGYQGGAYHFDGEGEYIDLPVNINPSAMPQVTIGAWARVESVIPNQRAQVLSHDNRDYDRTLGLEPIGYDAEVPFDPDFPMPPFMAAEPATGRHHFSAFAGLGPDLVTGPAVELGRWVFLAAVYTGSTVTMYVDGEHFSTTATPGQGVTYLRVGGNPLGSSSGEPFHGSVDNVFVYNRALSAAEITAIRTRGACGIAGSCVGVPGAGDIREGLARISQLTSQAGQAAELKAPQVRHVSRLITTATGYLDRTERTGTAQRQSINLRYMLVELDEAANLLRGTGGTVVAAREETIRVRTLVQARLDALN